jgi:hypothetical protein
MYIFEALGMENFGIFCGHFGIFRAIWCILCSFGIYFPILVYCTRKNLATVFAGAAEVIKG